MKTSGILLEFKMNCIRRDSGFEKTDTCNKHGQDILQRAALKIMYIENVRVLPDISYNHKYI